MYNRKFIALPALLLLMAGCANQPEQDTVQARWQDRTVQLRALERWKVDGKMALRNADRAESVNIAWTQEQDITRLNLSGPLGLSATSVSSDGNILEVKHAGTTRRYDISTPQAMVQQTGWDLPIKALQHWLKGLPAPELEVQAQEVEQGLLTHLQQSGWTITYESYGQFQHYALPTKLRIERADSRARVIIRNWTIEAA